MIIDLNETEWRRVRLYCRDVTVKQLEVDIAARRIAFVARHAPNESGEWGPGLSNDGVSAAILATAKTYCKSAQPETGGGLTAKGDDDDVRD